MTIFVNIIICYKSLPLARVYFLYGNDDPDLFIRRIFAAGNHGADSAPAAQKTAFFRSKAKFWIKKERDLSQNLSLGVESFTDPYVIVIIIFGYFRASWG
ncbi:hypothetical protein MY149_02885 [Acinetobacter indicus]|nr:hypothetical protein [Acinetobacter indicus]